MSLEAVQKVTETEQKARARKAEAVEQAKKLIADAERQGRERLSAAKAEESAAKHSEAVMEETRRSCDSLRQAAEGKLEDAAALIIRRVVGV